ncbi:MULTISPECIES: hypothetical protein [unclassified Nocardioides]|uniref:RsiG family protein n=1 Tax=unclassified Nocardioides TaxID=2615069 RepID=UPI00005705C1|nr:MULTISPECIES: hypothetical protein [unclassified Nocardioides]ABL80645.1 hypothetical protein Noca_1129 [Nocardioides sp. JS614]
MSGTRRRPVVDAMASEQLAGLDLQGLRSYRHRLEAEEDRVSYWRRLVHARLDLLAAGSRSDHPLTVDDLVRILGDTGTGGSRRALVSVRAADPLPELPELSEMWVTEVDPHDSDQVADAVERLTEAERQLTTYRRALHERIDEATGELIVRYRENPAAALSIIPEG